MGKLNHAFFLLYPDYAAALNNLHRDVTACTLCVDKRQASAVQCERCSVYGAVMRGDAKVCAGCLRLEAEHRAQCAEDGMCSCAVAAAAADGGVCERCAVEQELSSLLEN